MQSVSVLCWQPSEPRKEVPVSLLKQALEAVDTSSFWEVQTAFLILLLFFTFARSETPCPTTFADSAQDGGLDENKHLLVKDIKLEPVRAKRCTLPREGNARGVLLERPLPWPT